ncbi:uncharacterized protein LOC133713369 [Rosa rugosa]|uniref:uncharacterized protein LOC133713369 n=1 Tax=Rosa rugosa TaxID=74645 RepID=UPI002B402197|nr:uncharacterized protein LOC133713369 [Rosa rugosa]
MDESKDKGAAGEIVAGAVGSQGQVSEEGGPCNGDDLMVEVFGSNVYVGGVCTSGGGDEEDKEVGREESVEVDMGSGRNAGSVGGDGGEAGSGGKVESVEERRGVVAVEEVGVVVREESLKGAGAAAVAGSAGGETQVVDVEKAEKERKQIGGLLEEVFGRGIMDGGKQKKKVVDGGADLKVQKVSVADDEVRNPGIDTVAASSSETVENSCVRTRVVEKAPVVSEEGSSPKPLNGQRQVSAGGGDVSGTDKGDTVTSEVAGVEIGKIDESNSVGKQQVKIESLGGNVHTHINLPAHTVASSLPAKVVPVGEIAVTDGEDLLNSEKDHLKLEESVENMFHDIAQVGSNTSSLPAKLHPGCIDREGLLNFESHRHLKPEEIVDKNMVHDMAQVELNGGQEMEVDNQVNDAEHGELVSGNDQNSKIEKSCMNSVGKDQKLKFEESLNNSVTTDHAQSKTNVVHEVEVTEADMDGLYGESLDMEVDRDASHREQPKPSEEKIVIQEAMQPESSEIVPQLRYELPQKNEGTFSVSDLVWGKVKSHPWWPGQIFDFMAASEKAMKHHKKDCFLVAYFGDRTFAWNEVSSLKPFRSYFSQAEKQCNSETFHKAVNCVLEEVSRRVELGLSCSCIPKDVYEKIRFQIIENAGICHESSRVDGVDESASASSFESDKLLKYVKALARFPSGGSDKLELVIAKAHLLAFFRLKGYCSLPEFQFCGDLLESKTDNSLSGDKTCPGEITEHATYIGKDDKKTGPEIEELKSSTSHKRKHNLREGAYAKMKERSLSELMGGETGSPDGNDWLDAKALPSSGKRRKGAEYQAADLATQDGRKAVSHSTVSNTTPSPKPSFKIGECIQRAASQLSGSTIVKSSTDRPAVQGSDVPFQSSDDTLRGVNNTTKYSSLDELLSQLRSAAEEPLKEYNSLSTIVNFFSDFRNSVVVGQRSGVVLSVVDKVGGKKRKSNSVHGLPETFEFDDMNDTYWTDMVIQNGGEEQASRKRKTKYQPVILGQPEKPPQMGRRPYTRKKFSQGSQDLPPEKPVGYVDENAPAELVMSFSEVSSIPSETNLNKMFKRFGPLKEYETEVDRESSRARVVFKRCSDAEVACNSAGKFNIFGQITVNYQLNYTPSQLNYTPSITFGASTSAAAQDQEVQLVFPSHDHEMHLDLSTHDQMQLDLSTHDQMQLDLSTHDHMQLDLSTHDEMQLDLSTFEVNLV